MLGSETFASVFGRVPAGDTDKTNQLVRAAIRAGYAIVLSEPGTKKPLCTLTARQTNEADTDARNEAQARGNPRWEKARHACGLTHALTDETEAGKVVPRMIKRYGGVNVGLHVEMSRMIGIDVDTTAERQAFEHEYHHHTGETPTLTVSSPGSVDPATGERVHYDGGHYWFTLPTGIELPAGRGVYKAPGGWVAFWAGHQVLVPPSVRPEGPYRLLAGASPAPAFLVNLIDTIGAEQAQTWRDRAERVLDADDPIEVWSHRTSWDELLLPDGWTDTGLVDGCTCSIWTAPGAHASPKSATAHDLGCSKYDTEMGHGPLHIWTDNPPDWLQGVSTLSKLSYVARRDWEGSNSVAMRHLGLDARHDTDPAYLDAFDVPDTAPSSNGDEDFRGEFDDPASIPPTTEHAPKPATLADKIKAQLLTADQLDTLPDPRPLVDGVFNVDTLVRAIGKSGHGKSFVLLDMACHIAAGMPWHGHDVVPGKVVYVVAEGASGYKLRVQAWQNRHGVRLGDRLLTLPLPVQVMSGSGISEQWRAFIDVLSGLNPAFVVLDTQARVTVGAKENDATEMGIVVDAMDAVRRASTDTTICLVHHIGHAGDAGRGSTAIPAAVDTELKIEKLKDTVMVTCVKQKDSPDGWRMQFRLEAESDSAVIVSDETDGVHPDPFHVASLVGPDSSVRDRLAVVIYETFNHGSGCTKAEARAAFDKHPGVGAKHGGNKQNVYKAWATLERDDALEQMANEDGKLIQKWKLTTTEAIRLGLGRDD